ncbi:MAG: methylmalonyl-CoA epimerase [Chloroflexota bacterium]|nr:methylmalonyl-CoA epimerase [Chloroflexota bacterium]
MLPGTLIAANPTLHHVAFVVADLDAALEGQRRIGFGVSERFVLEEQGVEVATLPAGASWIELIRPLDPEGAIARFLAKRGEGFHHVAYVVPDLGAALQSLQEAGVRLIDTSPRTGAHGWRIAFIHPEACNGVLTELVQE